MVVKIKNIIYKVTCLINNKCYIGRTIFNIERRKDVHLRAAASGCKNKFYNALRKYQPECWKWEVLYENVSKNLLNAMERWMICIYNSYKCGYNSTKGGDGSLGHITSKKT